MGDSTARYSVEGQITIPSEYRRNPPRTHLKHLELQKPNGFSGFRVRVGKPQGLHKYPVGKGCWRKRKLLVMREIGVQTLPRVERRQISSRSSTINQRKGTELPVKDRVCKDIGAGKPLENWAAIYWKLVKKRVRNLRQRIYRVTQNGQWNQVRSLMKLMLRSYSNLLLSIRRITQENQGKLRPLGIPALENRVAQTMVKNALEPSWEARLESHSYGFRPGHSCQDAIEQCFLRLRNGCDTWILDADLKGAFDHLSHRFILDTLGQVPGRELIKQWLKAGYVEAEMFHPTPKAFPKEEQFRPCC